MLDAAREQYGDFTFKRCLRKLREQMVLLHSSCWRSAFRPFLVGPERPKLGRKAEVLTFDLGLVDRLALPKLIQIITPPLSHLHPFVPVIPPIVGAANGVTVAVGECAFNCVRMPEAAFVEHC